MKFYLIFTWILKNFCYKLLKDCFASVVYQCVNIFEYAVSVLPHVIFFSIIKCIESNIYVAFVGFLICDIYEILVFIFVRAISNKGIKMTSKEVNQLFKFSFSIVGFTENKGFLDGLFVKLFQLTIRFDNIDNNFKWIPNDS